MPPKKQPKATAKGSRQPVKDTVDTAKAMSPTNESCGVCEKHVDDSNEESIFCDGVCQAWMHRICTGLSATAFKHAQDSPDEYLCHYCSALSLKEEVKTLKKEITELEHKLSKFSDQNHFPLGSAPIITDLGTMGTTSATLADKENSQPPHQDTFVKKREDRDRKFKLIVYGIEESTKGTSRIERVRKDTQAISELLQDVDDSVPHHSIRDCIRLGKYNESKNRPTMIELTRASDVTSILSNRRNLRHHPGISIKPSLTRDQRKVESILLKKRWELINKDQCEKHDIKIKGNSLFVKGTKHGSVHKFEYIVNTNAINDLDDTDVNRTIQSEVPPVQTNGAAELPSN